MGSSIRIFGSKPVEVSTRKPTVYIAGPMRGIPEFNFPAFDAARDRWKAWGYDVISPADLDRDAGFDPTDTGEGNSHGFLVEAIERDVAMILYMLKPNSRDAIALLPGWENSKGAAVEIALGKFLDLNFVDARDGTFLEV